MTTTKTCGTCRHFTPTGHEDSGLRTPDGQVNWLYVIGICKHKPTLGTSCGRDGIAEWLSCFMHKHGNRK